MKKLIFVFALLIGATVAANANTGLANAASGAAQMLGLGTAALGAVVSRKKMNQIEALAGEQLNNYDGYDDYDDYDGYDDDFLDFDSEEGSFRDEARNGKTVVYTFTNNHTSAQSMYFHGGFKNYTSADALANGVAKQGAFTSIEGTAGVLAGSASSDTVDNLRRFFNWNPARIIGMKISGSGAGGVGPSQLQAMVFTIEQQSPFKNLGDRTIIVSNYITEKALKDNIVTVPEGFDMNNQCAIKFTLLPGATVNITCVFGGILNNAKALERKARIATRNIQANG